VFCGGGAEKKEGALQTNSYTRNLGLGKGWYNAQGNTLLDFLDEKLRRGENSNVVSRGGGM